MYYPGPDRYQGYENRAPQSRNEAQQYGYMYPPPNYPVPTPPPSRDYYGSAQTDVSARLRVITPIDQGEELLDRLEQTGRVPSKDKFRRMACMTFICTGTCPYNDRCVFMHDFRIRTENVKVRTTKQLKASNIIKDTFYWPDMTRKDILRQLDAQGLPDANQRYTIPESFASAFSSFHNRGLYSVWNHFVEFCQNNNRIQAENVLTEADAFFQMSDHLGNRHIYGTYRLKIFVHLSKTRGQDSLELDLQRLDSSFGSGLTTRSSGGIGAAAMFTPLSISTSAASVSPSTSASSYRFRAIATDSGVQVMENATLSDSGCPRTPMLGSISIDTTYSNGEVSIFSDLSGFGGQRPDAEEGYFLGDLPGTPTMGQQHQHHQQHQKQHRFDGGFSPSTSRSRAMPPTQQPSLGYLQARDQGKLIAFSPQQASFSPRASPAGAYGKTSLLSSQARPFSPHTHQSLYMGSPPQYGQRQQQQAATGREQPAPFPSQSRYQPALQHQASPLHRAAPPVPLPPLPRSFASSTAGPVLSSGGRYHIVPPEPSQVPSVPITAPCIGDADAPHSVRSYDGGTYVITPPTQESAPSSWVAPSDQSSRQLQQRSTPVAPVTRNSPPGQRGEQASRLVDDATTLANTRANFHVSLSPTTEFSASISAITSPSPKNTKTVMWADQAATATVEEELEDPSDTSSISAGSEHGEASSQEFDILQQAVDLEASSTEEEDWQFPSCLLASSSAPAATARNTSCSWTLQDNDDEDFRVDLLGDLQYEDAGDETEDVLADVAGSSLLYTVSAGPSSEREQVLRPASWRDSVLTEEATPLPSWLSAGSPFTGTVGEASRTANLHLGSGHLVLSNIDAGDESDDSYYPLLSLTSLATLTSLSLSPIKETASAEGNTESNHSGENSPISPHFGAWPAPGVEKASSGKEKLFAH